MNKRLGVYMERRENRISSFALEELIGIHGPVIVGEDAQLAQALAAPLWSRWSKPGRPGTLWPPKGPFAVATLRIPKARRAVEMAVHALASVIDPKGEFYIYGSNDEGIRSVGKLLAPIFEEVEIIACRSKCRLIRAHGVKDLYRTLDHWAEHSHILFDGHSIPWMSYPGLFAKGGIDRASKLLLEGLEVHGSVLDYGCGTGVLSYGVLVLGASRVDALDSDALAIKATQSNVPEVRTHLGDGWHAVGHKGSWDMIVSNPPLHRGISEDYRLLRDFLDGAPERSKCLVLVVQGRIPIRPWLEERYKYVCRIRKSSSFHVWQALH
ncbi:MAG: methyltransferase [Desulfarculaceae bacterium]|nr:methyltransferase [Desulfarculaceae bacterium]